ncbi:MAG TPA: DUF4446 family protein [Solirubrobacteraceae bacterium]|nr:DUF4446 family protein [Solirubrobacteraceae bacterium]
MNGLGSTQGIVALVGAGLGLVALIGCGVLALRLSRITAAQRAVLGEHGERDLVTHAASLQSEVGSLNEFVTDVAQRLDGRMAVAEQRLDGAITFRALLRYDAMGEMSGRQSTSIALLDASHSGVVLSSIHHRDQARLYAKQVRAGKGELELSPEEAEAVRLALADAGPG